MAPLALTLPTTMGLNATSTAYSVFTDVDFVRCDARYVQPAIPSVDDCLAAIHLLPRHERQPVTWYNRPLSGIDPQHVLPLVRTSGQYSPFFIETWYWKEQHPKT